MIDSIRLATLYTAFAIVATFFNILAQDICSYIYSGPFSILVSIIIGTGVGLVIKYVLDKKYIFKYKTQNAQHDGKVFMLYTVMGIFTTIIFWGLEFGFHAIFETKEMRYVGGVIGLMIGYICKYYLDKRFVFRTV
ncbi:GtrA family protein [Acinetobacter baumannii]|uniref:GtrA family protein n=1 Tax=Acinetobacter calcoaceticus/baumannii complex TaxID=909768 RepID=UPI000DE61057|nr:GtrA family protein [Acinetobacter nosocomialis]SSV63682.1 GtrA-like protein [Acinetobacter nosocomialis]